VFRDRFDVATIVNSPCGKDTIVNINTQLTANNAKNPNGSGFITDDTVGSVPSSLEVNMLTYGPG
jgi:hypothetical protein